MSGDEHGVLFYRWGIYSIDVLENNLSMFLGSSSKSITVGFIVTSGNIFEIWLVLVVKDVLSYVSGKNKLVDSGMSLYSFDRTCIRPIMPFVVFVRMVL